MKHENIKLNFNYEFNNSYHSKTKFIIYKIENTISKKYYIGQTKRELRHRWNDYKYHLLSPIKKNKKNDCNLKFKNSVQKHFNIIGDLSFLHFTIIEIINPNLSLDEKRIEIDNKEKYWISEYRKLHGKENVYNVMDGGSSFDSGNKISKSKKEFYQTERGKLLKEKLSKIHKGKIISDQHKAIISNVCKQRIGENHPMFGRIGELNPMFGIKHSETSKNKISKNRKGKNSGIDNKNAKIYDLSNNPLMSPTGELFCVVECCSEFARKHNLLPRSLNKLLNKQLKTHRKWRLINVEKSNVTYIP